MISLDILDDNISREINYDNIKFIKKLYIERLIVLYIFIILNYKQNQKLN
jgi:hypothetical protein